MSKKNKNKVTGRTRATETATRKHIDSVLSHLGWDINEQSSSCSVYTERAKTKKQNQKFDGKRPDYVLYEPKTDNPIAIIEAKRPGVTLSKAIDQAIKDYAEPLGVDIVFASDGTLVESYDRRSQGPLLLDGEPITDLIRCELLLRFYQDGPDLYTPTQSLHTKQELIKTFAKANDLLRKEGLREGIERFSEFSNLLFLKLISEIENERESEGRERQLEKRYCWEAFSTKKGNEMLDYLNDTVLPRLVDSYNHSGDVFQNSLQIANGSTLKKIVDELSELSLLNADTDVKGDAFEYFLRYSVTVGNDLGEYFTPRHIVRLLVELVDPRYEETVYDPCCGTGGFLIEAFHHISQKVKHTPKTRKILEEKTIYGRELTGTARIAKMNMILAGDGHTNIVQMDSLSEPVDEQYDVVLTNFPFSQETDYGDLYGLDTEDANPVFLKHAIDACKEGGKIGIVVPEGILFDEKSHCVTIRRYLLENCDLESVIALHSFVFRPYTGQPTSLLIMKKGEPTNSVWFFNVGEDGFKKTGSKNGRPPKQGQNDLIDLRSIWAEKADTENSFSVGIDKIKENSYKLSMSSYLERNEGADWLPLGGDNGVCNIKLGATPKTSERRFWGGKHQWVTISDMTSRYVKETERTITEEGMNNSSVKLLPKGTVLLSFKLTIGKVAIAGCDLYTNEAIAGLVPKPDIEEEKKVLPEYLYHILPALNLKAYMQPAAKGKTLNKGILQSIRIPVPSIEEQQRFIDEMNEKEAEALSLREQASDIDKELWDQAQMFLAR